jgi:hypothetical protein
MKKHISHHGGINAKSDFDAKAQTISRHEQVELQRFTERQLRDAEILGAGIALTGIFGPPLF